MQKSPLVSTEWLANHLDDPTIVILDASSHLPDTGRSGRAEYDAAHIPGARYFDLYEISDQSCPLPATLPPADYFASCICRLGISNDKTVIVYDNSDVRSAARAWWMFHVMGHEDVHVLDGGFQKWQAEGRPVTDKVAPAKDGDFNACFNAALYRSQEQVLELTKSRTEQIVDARGAPRFEGTMPEARPGLRSGHIPTAINLPFMKLYAPDHTLLPPKKLREVIEAAGVDLKRPVTTTCGSGVTACVLRLAFECIGKTDVAIYDGSWTEWGSCHDLPIETGPATPAPRT